MAKRKRGNTAILTPSHRLSNRERGAAALAGVIALALAALLLYLPPEVKEAGGEQCQSVQECGVIEVAADTETIALVFVLISGGSMLIALLGVRFTKIGAKDITLEAVVAEVSPGAEMVRPSKDFAHSEAEWERLPDWAKAALTRWAEAGTALSTQPRLAVVEAEQEGGRRAWLVTVRLDDGSHRMLRLTYGRGSSRVADQWD